MSLARSRPRLDAGVLAGHDPSGVVSRSRGDRRRGARCRTGASSHSPNQHAAYQGIATQLTPRPIYDLETAVTLLAALHSDITLRYSESERSPMFERLNTLTRDNHTLERENQALRARLAAD